MNVYNTEWRPVAFCYPSIEACPHSLTDMKPIPYRPFRWGAYQCVFFFLKKNSFVYFSLILSFNIFMFLVIRLFDINGRIPESHPCSIFFFFGSVTMGIRNMPWNDWIEVIIFFFFHLVSKVKKLFISR